MQVRVLSFGALRELLGAENLLDVPTGTAVSDVLYTLGQKAPIGLLESSAIAVNQQYVARDHVLSDGDEVAVLPPVSGGRPLHVALVTEPITPAELLADFHAGADGAVVTFEGRVRDNTRGRRTLHLDYEAYEPMALQQMRELAQKALAEHGVRDVVLVHRLGRLTVGEISVFIAVASGHRAQAFAASRWLIDTLKQTVPIWKKEQFEDGAVWADGEPFPEAITL
jgi:molybdopterin synthase catalytic subunit